LQCTHDARVNILKARGGRTRDAAGVICIASVSLSFRRPAYSLLRLQPLMACKPDNTTRCSKRLHDLSEFTTFI
jgi:hypothetical protein